MQQTPPTTEAVPQPSAPPVRASDVTVVMPGDAGALRGIPGTPDVWQGLQARRELLNQQLEGALGRRQELMRALQVERTDIGREGLQTRIRTVDGRIVEIEQALATTDRQLASTPPEVLAMTGAVPRYEQHGYSDDDAVGMMFGGFAAGIVLTMIAGRLRRRWAMKRAKAGKVADVLGEEQRLDRLMQAVDAMAVEVERIGEGQRFVTQVLADRREPAVLREAERG